MFKRLFHKLGFTCRYLFFAKWEWRAPSRCDVLVYDDVDTPALNHYLSAHQTGSLYLRGQLARIPALLRALLDCDFWRGRPLLAYARAYIALARPKVVITTVDNKKDFYELSSPGSRFQTVLLQNGLREEFLGGQRPGCRVDHMLVFGESIANYYREHLEGNVQAAGSLLNNYCPRSNASRSGVLFLSEFKSRGWDLGISQGKEITWDEFFEAEKHVLPWLSKWCAKNGKLLMVAGRSREDPDEEIAFYNEYLTHGEWKFLVKSGPYSNYAAADAAEVVVSIDSTLGLESMARGNRTAFLACRGRLLSLTDRDYGWPEKFSDDGSFWTNRVDIDRFTGIMDYLARASDDEWESASREHRSLVMCYDPDNTRLTAVLNSILRQ